MRLVVLGLFLLAGQATFAEEVHIIQAGQEYLSAEAAPKADAITKNPIEGKAYIVKKLKIKKGDKIVFENQDKVTHNAYGPDFDLQAQTPGQTKTETFDKVGKQMIKCAIHPKMKFELEVE